MGNGLFSKLYSIFYNNQTCMHGSKFAHEFNIYDTIIVTTISPTTLPMQSPATYITNRHKSIVYRMLIWWIKFDGYIAYTRNTYLTVPNDISKPKCVVSIIE